jgi:hypothetical protein
MAFMRLGKESFRPLDGSCQELGEEGNIEGKQSEMSFGSFIAPIHINHVADYLKNIEGDSNGHNKAKQMASMGKIIVAQYACHGTGEKVVILEHKEDAEVANATGEKKFSLS